VSYVDLPVYGAPMRLSWRKHRMRCSKQAMPPEVQRLGRTLRRWFDKICNYHLAKVTNAATEALNNLVKRIKRIGFGLCSTPAGRIGAFWDRWWSGETADPARIR